MNSEQFIKEIEKLTGHKFEAESRSSLFLRNRVCDILIEFRSSGVEFIRFSVPEFECAHYPPTVGLEPDFQRAFDKIERMYSEQLVKREEDIKQISQFIEQLETIRKAPVYYKPFHYEQKPCTAVVLEGSEVQLFRVYGFGIRYKPSVTAERVPQEGYVVARSVKDILCQPITGPEDFFTARPDFMDRRMDVFVSDNVKFVPSPKSKMRKHGTVTVGVTE